MRRNHLPGQHKSAHTCQGLAIDLNCLSIDDDEEEEEKEKQINCELLMKETFFSMFLFHFAICCNM